MFIEKEGYYYLKKFKEFGIVAAYSKKNSGNMSDYCNNFCEEVGSQSKNRKKLLKTLGLQDKQEVMAYQTHSNNVQIIDSETNKYYYEKEENIDGFVTTRKDLVLFTFYADCLPIYVYDTKNEVIGVWHSGWLGTFREIMANGLEIMKFKYNSQIEDIIIGLGVGIAQKDYEVGKEFYDKFCEKFNGITGKREIVKQSFLFDECNGKYYFDNTKFNYLMALYLGIREENIEISRESTYDEKFFSYRRDKEKSGRATGLISFLC